MKLPHPGSRVLLALLPLAAVTLVACGESERQPGGPDEATVASGERTAKKDLPPPLARNFKQANELIEGGTAALEDKLRDLRGFPVVVNQWGSWCPPCRAEFPFFAESAERHLDEVAFLGVDIQDDRGAAEAFLAELPVPYPSIFDQDAAAVDSLGWTGASPTTWMIDERGEIVHQRPGAYANGDELEEDIEQFLLN